MGNPLSYKELEKKLNDLQAEKQKLVEEFANKDKASRAKEHLYEQIINHTHEGLAILQGDKLKFVNKPALTILKSTKSELESKSFSDLIHPDQRGSIIQNISTIIDGTNENFVSDIEIINKNNQIVKVRIFVEQILNKKSQVALMIKFIDIGEFSEKQEKIEELENSLELFEQHGEEGVFLLEQPKNKKQSIFSWIIKDANSAAAKILNKEKNDLQDKSLNKFLIPDFDYQIPGDIDKDYSEEIEVFILNLKKYFKLKIHTHSKGVVVCNILDVNELVLLKNELNRNLQRNELITEILSIVNQADSYENRFRNVLERVGYQLKPKRIAIIHQTENRKQGKVHTQWAEKDEDLFTSDFFIPYQRVPSWIKMLNERKMILGFSFQYLPEDIQNFLNVSNIKNAYVFPLWVDDELFGSVLYENKEEIEWDNTEINYLKMVSVLLNNLTAHKTTEDKIIDAKEKAEESDRLKSSFLANMSHDIRIPMTSIIGFSDLLVDEDLSITEREEFVELISKSGQDLLTLVDNIVDMAKIETGQLKLQSDKCALPNLFKDLHGLHSDNSKIIYQDDLDLIVDLPSKYKELYIDTDVFRIKQVFNNLIENAIKFTDRGEVKFGISNVWDETIEFYVHDTGIGIAEETQHIIFKRFGKIDRTYTKEYNGTGLGLAICKSIVGLMGGDIRVVSYPTKGSTFYFTHPMPKNLFKEATNDSNNKESKIGYDWKSKTVLIVEDVEQNYKFLEYMLEQTGIVVVWAQNGKEAVDYFANGSKADIVLMDIRLPIMDGIEATKQIKKLTAVPIIAQTAYTLGDEKDKAIQAGCVDYISKPVNGEQLLEMMNSNFK